MKYVIAAALFVTPTIASAQSMNAQEFHRRATALQKKGPLAVFPAVKSMR